VEAEEGNVGKKKYKKKQKHEKSKIDNQIK
jgi:hypothetical protein